jgi:hypothetical protein
MSQLTTTLNKIREKSPCKEGWEKLLKHLEKTKADDEALLFSTIVESNGIYDALWCCRSAPEHEKEWRLFAVWCARQVQHLMTDERSINAIDISERFAHGNATQEELAAARDSASSAAWYVASSAAWYVARAAARAEAWDAAWDAASAVASAAASAAARDEAWTVAIAAPSSAAWDSARAEEMASQKEQFLKIVNGE